MTDQNSNGNPIASGGSPFPPSEGEALCDEPQCGHPINHHGEGSGCDECRCPFYASDLLPMTPEQIAWARAQRR
jgi:hypothetical protein